MIMGFPGKPNQTLQIMLFKKQETETFQSLMDQNHLLDIDLFGTHCNLQEFMYHVV